MYLKDIYNNRKDIQSTALKIEKFVTTIINEKVEETEESVNFRFEIEVSGFSGCLFTVKLEAIRVNGEELFEMDNLYINGMNGLDEWVDVFQTAHKDIKGFIEIVCAGCTLS